MKTMQDWFDEYGESHQNATNKLIHWICVPAIFLSILGLVSSIPHDFLSAAVPLALRPFAHFGTLALAVVLIFYLRISFPMFLGMLGVSVGMLLANYGLQVATASLLSYPLACLIIFVAAWIGQFVGHNIEGKKPSFFQDLQFLLIGPAWLLGFIYRKVGLRY